MVLVDTSVWISHFRNGNKILENLLNDGEILCHQFIVGEIACGNLKNREEILSLLQSIPVTIMAEHDEVLQFIKHNHLTGKGIGYIDVHLILSAILTDIPIWTFDKNLYKVSKCLNVHYL